MIPALIGLPLLGATILLIGGRRTNAWGHVLGVLMSGSSFGVGVVLLLGSRICFGVQICPPEPGDRLPKMTPSRSTLLALARSGWWRNADSGDGRSDSA